MKKICVFAVLCFCALPLFAEESVVQWNAELELATPAGENRSFEETIGTGEYSWRTTQLALGRFSGHGIYTKLDRSDEWFARHTVAYAPLAYAPWLAAALEYGVRSRGGFLSDGPSRDTEDFWQGGIQYIASRVSNVCEYFQYLSFAYFSDVRDAPSSSEWVLRFETQQIELNYLTALFVEGIYRYRPSEERTRDVGNMAFWLADPRELNPIFHLDVGASVKKEDAQWIPFLGVRLRF